MIDEHEWWAKCMKKCMKKHSSKFHNVFGGHRVHTCVCVCVCVYILLDKRREEILCLLLKEWEGSHAY
jgi:hypothetical protein